jgi:hypothetical protein
MSKETKEKILDALEGYKEFEVSVAETVYYKRKTKAKSEEELRERFYNGEWFFDDKDIVDSEIIDDLEIEEV